MILVVDDQIFSKLPEPAIAGILVAKNEADFFRVLEYDSDSCSTFTSLLTLISLWNANLTPPIANLLRVKLEGTSLSSRTCSSQTLTIESTLKRSKLRLETSRQVAYSPLSSLLVSVISKVFVLTNSTHKVVSHSGLSPNNNVGQSCPRHIWCYLTIGARYDRHNKSSRICDEVSCMLETAIWLGSNILTWAVTRARILWNDDPPLDSWRLGRWMIRECCGFVISGGSRKLCECVSMYDHLWI